MPFSRAIRLAASPCFLLLALVLRSSSDTASQICGLIRSEMTFALFGSALQVPVATLGSMWVMYFLMAVFHSGPWIVLFSASAVERDCCEPESGGNSDNATGERV